MNTLTLFYDGECPLCVKEMARLRRSDRKHCLLLVDIHSPMFQDYPKIDRQKASQILHGLTQDGDLLLGLDATCHAWKLVGKGQLVGLSRLPILRQVTDRLYVIFARNRYTFSKWLTGKARCESGRCNK